MLSLLTDVTVVCSTDELEFLEAYRESKRNFVAVNTKKRKCNRDGSARKAYTSTKRRLRGAAEMLSPFSRRMRNVVKVLPALAACCLAGLVQLASFVAVSQDNFASMSQTDKWAYVCNGVRHEQERFYSACGEHSMCWSCWVKLHGFSESYFYTARKAVERTGRARYLLRLVLVVVQRAANLRRTSPLGSFFYPSLRSTVIPCPMI